MTSRTPLASDAPLSVLPLGGLGKIGMNAMLVGTRGRYVLLDCGIGFAPNTVLGAERMLPDLGFLKAHRDQIEAVVITHGHEDHIGALPWVLPVLDPATPVHASTLTRELIRHRLQEYDLWDEARVRVFEPKKRFDCGPFQVDALRVTHSIPDCSALALRADAGTVLHTADWKIDEEPMDGEAFDREGFEALGRDGVDLMLSDSTSVMAPGRTSSETEVMRQLERRIAPWPGRVVVTLFASNIHRLRGLDRIAAATGRRLVLCGRSLWTHLEASERVGTAPVDRSRLLDIADASGLALSEALVVTTGSQGQPRSALGRAAAGGHELLKLGKEDLVLHSARVIPGNEGDTYAMWNQLAALGVTLNTDRAIHTSGHAQRDELKELLQLVRPKLFVPVHGETTFLYEHAKLATELKFATLVLHNGERLDLRGRSRAMGDKTPPSGEVTSPLDTAERVEVALTTYWNDGPATGDEAMMRLAERKRLGWNGVIALDLAVGRLEDERADVLEPVRMEARALFLGEDDVILEELRGVARSAVRGCPAGTPWKEIAEAVRASVRAAARRATDKRPEVLVTLHGGRLA